MRMPRACFFLGLSVLAAGCRNPSPKPAGTGSATVSFPAPIASNSVEKGDIQNLPERRARYSPRPSRVGMSTAHEMSRSLELFGPISNNFERRLTAAIADDATGIIDHGRRYLFAAGRARLVDEANLPVALNGVVPVPSNFGGGFVFFGEESVFYAPQFDARLVPIGGAVGSFMLGPKCIFLKAKGGETQFLWLTDGKPIGAIPAMLQSIEVHPSGFMVGFVSELTNQPQAWTERLYFSNNARLWKKLSVVGDNIHVFPDGDALILKADGNRIYRLDRDGKVTPAKLSAAYVEEKQLEARIFAFNGSRALPGPTKVPTAASLLAEGWIPSSRHDNEWFLLRDGQLYVARGTDLSKVGPRVDEADSSCSAVEIAGRPFAVCFQLGSLFQVFLLDLDTGARVMEREVKVTQGIARSMGTVPGAYPRTLFIAASCDGQADGAMCVRGPDGTYRSVDAPSKDFKGRVWIFPGEVIYTAWNESGAVELHRGSNLAPIVISAEAMKPVTAAIQPTPIDPHNLIFTESGFLRTHSGVRIFHGPNPMKPVPPSPMNHAVDLPLDGSAPKVSSVPGIIATAGPHALRIDNGKLFESANGWETWHEVAPPPTGLPTDLRGAMCDDRGCQFGPWARVGWDWSASR